MYLELRPAGDKLLQLVAEVVEMAVGHLFICPAVDLGAR